MKTPNKNKCVNTEWQSEGRGRDGGRAKVREGNVASGGERTEEQRTRETQLHTWNLYKYYKPTFLQENKYTEKKKSFV